MNAHTYPAEFEALWQLYPKRIGTNSKRKAYKCYQSRIKEGHEYEIIYNGTKRYLHFCDKTGKTGTEFVLQAATFYGISCHFEEEWELPQPKETLQQRGERLGITARPGESWEAYEKRILQTR